VFRPGEPIPLALHQEQADDRLRAGDEDALFREIELVVEGDFSESYASLGHRSFPP
jgi:hypothetical protein